MATHELDIAAFRAAFPQFASEAVFPDATITLRWTEATVYIGADDGCLLSGAALQLALEYLTAHLMASFVIIGRGQTPGVITDSRVDKVAVSVAPPPTRDGWRYWLATTPYGMALWALLTARSAGGWYAGGRPERLGFRGIAGRFG